MSKRPSHPDVLFNELMSRGGRKQKLDNLASLHKLCEAQYRGSKDFSIPAIGRLWEVAGGLRARALYNAPSADYRALLDAWKDHAGQTDKSRNAEATKFPFLSRIDDPALRALVQGTFIARDKLQAELNLLKSLTVLQINRSSRPQTTPHNSPLLNLEEASVESVPLTPSELEALRRSVSADFLEDEGWKEGRQGEIVNEKGRRLFQPGFAKAIRKVLRGVTKVGAASE